MGLGLGFGAPNGFGVQRVPRGFGSRFGGQRSSET